MLKSERTIAKALQLAVIIGISVAASYIFQHTHMAIEVNGICAYCYVAYAATIVFCYVCVSHYSKYPAFFLSFALLSLVIFGPHQKVIGLFPVFTPLLATLMGFFSVLLVPDAKGRGFFGFLFVLILPVLLAESKVGGFLLLTSGSSASYEVYAITITIIGGCFYLRYAVSTNSIHREFVLKGASQEDVGAISWWSNLIVASMVAGSVATASLLPFAAPILEKGFQQYVAAVPLFILVLTVGLGVVVVMMYLLRTSAGEGLPASNY